MYAAKAVVLFTDTSKPPTETQATDQMAKEIEIIESPEVLAPVVTELKLDQAWAKRYNSGLDALPMQDALDHFHKVLAVKIRPLTSLVDITVSSENPQEAADVANAIADHYIGMLKQQIKSAKQPGIAALSDQLDQQAKVVEQMDALVAQNPQDAHAKQQSEDARALLSELHRKLNEIKAEAEVADPDAEIVVRAEAPPE